MVTCMLSYLVVHYTSSLTDFCEVKQHCMSQANPDHMTDSPLSVSPFIYV